LDPQNASINNGQCVEFTGGILAGMQVAEGVTMISEKSKIEGFKRQVKSPQSRMSLREYEVLSRGEAGLSFAKLMPVDDIEKNSSRVFGNRGKEEPGLFEDADGIVLQSNYGDSRIKGVSRSPERVIMAPGSEHEVQEMLSGPLSRVTEQGPGSLDGMPVLGQRRPKGGRLWSAAVQSPNMQHFQKSIERSKFGTSQINSNFQTNYGTQINKGNFSRKTLDRIISYDTTSLLDDLPNPADENQSKNYQSYGSRKHSHKHEPIKAALSKPSRPLTAKNRHTKVDRQSINDQFNMKLI
jgi:hypothetical protein